MLHSREDIDANVYTRLPGSLRHDRAVIQQKFITTYLKIKWRKTL
jgi:hypothetical protein